MTVSYTHLVNAMAAMQQIQRPQGGITRLNVGQLRGGESRNTIPALSLIHI